MYHIKEVAELTGLSAHTLRYYEKIGLIPPPARLHGQTRLSSDKNINFILFISSLKQTRMTLEEIKEFVQEGCIWDLMEEDEDVTHHIEKKVQILQKHLYSMQEQVRELQYTIALTKEKLAFYHTITQTKKESSLP